MRRFCSDKLKDSTTTWRQSLVTGLIENKFWGFLCDNEIRAIFTKHIWDNNGDSKTDEARYCKLQYIPRNMQKGFCFAVLCCGYTLTEFPISIRLTSQALWQSNDCPNASKATLMNMDKYLMWIHYERLRNHNKAKHNKTVCIFLGIYCISGMDYCGPHVFLTTDTSISSLVICVRVQPG